MLSKRQRTLLHGRRLHAPHGISGRTRRATTAQRNTIPDSAIYRVILDDVGSGSIAESVQGLSGTNSGIASVSNNYQGGAAGDGDGSSHISFSEFTEWTQNRTSGWGVGFTIENYGSQPNSFPRIIGAADSAFDETVSVCTNVAQSDRLEVRLQVGGNEFFASGPGGQISDGNRHRVLIGADADSAAAAAGFVDNAPISMTVDRDASPSSPSAIGADTLLFATTNGSSTAQEVDAILDDVIVYNKLPDASLAQEDYDLQPWA